MDTYLLEWANLLLRWAHVVVAIAWIGSSFYFVFLDLSLTPPSDPALREQGVSGELWAVHGGGFYHPTKYLVAPAHLPERLHWFYWESYATWLTGFALLCVLYLFQASIFLVDPRVHEWSPGAAAAAALALLIGFWLAYDLVCRVFGTRRNGERIVGVLVALAVAALTWLACALFAARAAFVLAGAMMATAMTANVAMWIIPGQRRMVAQLRGGEPVDPLPGQRAKQRSVHNTYFTLPVLFAMLSNHVGWLYAARYNALVLLIAMAAGALIRHSFVARHQARVQGRRVPWEYAGAGTLLLAGLALALAPARGVSAVSAGPLRFADVQAVIAQRCVACHNAQLHQKGIELDSPALVARHASQIYQQAVLARSMPLNNATQISEGERALLQRWVEGGAPTD